MLKIKLTERAQKEWSEWVKADRKKAEKIEELIREIAKKPYAGRGKPEALKHELSGCWSRRIS